MAALTSSPASSIASDAVRRTAMQSCSTRSDAAATINVVCHAKRWCSAVDLSAIRLA
jgi:hypothetical protein